MDEAMTCPFCGWSALKGEYAMLLHMETQHAEGPSPFVAEDEARDGVDSEYASSMGSRGDNDNNDDNNDDNNNTNNNKTNSSRRRKNNDASEDEVQYVECPIDGCGKILLAEELNRHIELHAEEVEAEVDDGDGTGTAAPTSRARANSKDATRRRDGPASSSPPHRTRERRAEPPPLPPSSPSRQQRTIRAWKDLFRMRAPASSTLSSSSSSKRQHRARHGDNDMPNGKRLGRAQLGKYAHEERMPNALIDLLQRGAYVKSEGVIPVLAQLLEQCASTKSAYLCHTCVQHISKLRREGAFCGYRNIQTMSSYIIGVKSQGWRRFDGKIPSIFQIQEFIESAWDHGINASGRLETGGIKGTRKFIGTPEAQAMFRYLEIPCDAQAFKHKEAGRSEALLLEHVETYFQSGVTDPRARVHRTELPPIYLQRAGHSMTIIGLEQLKDGSKNLLVFDPFHHDPPSITKLVGREFRHKDPSKALKPYRRGNQYLKRYSEFEVLRLTVPQ